MPAPPTQTPNRQTPDPSRRRPLSHTDAHNMLHPAPSAVLAIPQAVEVGVHQGAFSREMLSAWHGRRLHLVDSWQSITRTEPGTGGATYTEDREADLEATLGNVAPFGERRFLVVRERSDRAAAMYSDGYFDWVYIDANHEYAACRRDIQTWYKKLRVGGIMSGDDYYNGFHTAAGYTFGCRDAVDEFAAVYGYRVHSSSESWAQGKTPSWYFVKC